MHESVDGARFSGVILAPKSGPSGMRGAGQGLPMLVWDPLESLPATCQRAAPQPGEARVGVWRALSLHLSMSPRKTGVKPGQPRLPAGQAGPTGEPWWHGEDESSGLP